MVQTIKYKEMKRTLENYNSLISAWSKSDGHEEKRISDYNKNTGLLLKKRIYHFLLSSILLISTYSLNATVYYVSNSSDASVPGPNIVCTTADAINSLTLQPGDQILLKRGDEWTGTITVIVSGTSASPIVYGAYGTGDKPVIKGTSEVTGWTKHSGNIYKATLPERANQLFVDGVKMSITKNVDAAINEKFLVTRRISSTEFICTDLIGTDWTGAYAIMQLAGWSYQSFKVVDCNTSTGQVTLANPPAQWVIQENSPFLMVNSLFNLTGAGQWCIDEASNTVYLWTPNGDLPTNHTVEASTIQDGIVINNVDNVTIKDLKIFGFDNEGIAVNNSFTYANDGIAISNCEFEYNYASAINVAMYPGNLLYTPTNIKITSNTIIGSSGRSIAAKVSGGIITGNTIDDTGLLQDIGLDGYVTEAFNGNNGAVAMLLSTSAVTISNNKITDFGYNGLVTKGTNNNVRNNVLKRGCLHLSDGGAIYSYGVITGTTISGNIVSEIGGIGTYETHGIYMDATTNGVTIEDNTVSTCDGFGIFLSNSINLTVTGNTVYNCDEQIRFSQWLSGWEPINNVISNNIMYALISSQRCATYGLTTELATNRLELIGNKYFSNQNLQSIEYKGTKMPFVRFKEITGQETSGVSCDSIINNYSNVVYTSDNLISSSDFVAAITSGTQTFKQTWGDNTERLLEIKFNSNTSGNILNANNYIGSSSHNFFVDSKSRRQTIYKETEPGHFNMYFWFTDGNIGDTIYMRDISVREVTADLLEPTEKSKLFVNETTSTKSYSLSGTYKDLDGNVVTGSITLQPFTSRIFTKQDDSVPDNQSPTIKGQSFNIQEVMESGSFVGQVVASDPDDGQSLTYSIVSGNSGELFSLHAASGELTANTGIQFSKDTTVVLTVKVTDNASSPLSAQANVTINISATEVPDTSVPTISSFVIPSNSTSLTVSVSEFVSTDNIGISGYLLTETSTVPDADDTSWSDSVPAWYTFSSTGTKTLYAWVKDAAGNISGMQSATVIITLPAVSFTEDITICEGSSYEGWTTTGQYERVLEASSGADSIVTTNLTVNPVVYVSEDVYILEGESYQGWTDSGEYERILTSFSGCDSIVTTKLTVTSNKYTTEDITICEGSSYEGWTSAGTYERTLQVSSGVDSIVTTNLYVNPIVYISEDIIILEGESYQGWTESGEYERTLTASTGCDSIVNTNLTVTLNKYTTEDISICEGSSYEGWTSAGTYERTLLASSGVDSIVTTNLTVSPIIYVSEDITILEGGSYQGWTESGEYERILTSSSGCDSIVTTNLTVTSNKYITEDITICEGSSYEGWTSAGTYERILQASSGVDSIVTTNLYVNPIVYISEDITILEGESYQGWTESGEYEMTLTASTGCDSIVTTNLTVTLNKYTTEDITICEGSSYEGWTIAGTYERTLQSSSGVDSIVTTNLYVNPVYHINENITINEGDNYLGWTEPGEYTRNLISISGCDSIVITNLTVVSNLSTQTIDLSEGWNIFSSHLKPKNLDLASVVELLRESGQLIMVEDESGNTYSTELKSTEWINNIGEMQETEGYKIQVSSDCNFEIEGTQVELPLDIPLKEGWNYISFPHVGSVDAMDVIQPLIDDGSLVKVMDERGDAIEEWSFLKKSRWVNRIKNFVSGEGYMVQVNSNCVLQIKETYAKSALLSSETVETEYFSVDYNGNGSNHMNINISGLIDANFQVGDEIAAFDGDVCVGVVKLTEEHMTDDAVAINASASDEGVQNGFTEEHSIELRVWNMNKNATSQTFTELVEGDMIYQKHASVFVTMSEQDVTGINDFESIEIEMYPNPARDNVNLKYSKMPAMGTRIILTDMTGKQLLNREVQSVNEVLDIQSYPSGMYFIKTFIGDKFKVHKLIKN